MSVFPSGKQYEISAGDLHATAVEVGGGLRAFVAGDLAVLDGFARDEMCHDARGDLLIPWPNRLAGGRYTFQGQPYQVPLNEPADDNAIHGLVRWVNWSARDHTANSVTMAHQLYPMSGYPFALDLSARYTLTGHGLEVTLQTTNIGDGPCPFGAGQHPYLSVGTPLINADLLRIPARTTYRYNERLIPLERIPVAGTPLDFRTLHEIGDTVINKDYTDLQRDADGRARVLLAVPDHGPSVEVWMDQAFPHVTVYTGETIEPPSRRRRSLAIEPMTCPPNAFASGEDLVVLQPGETWQGQWGITVSQA